ncbi:MAG: NPCBM/NEW2 domain-containing protein [Candidatus Poribacteria bacterium]|nr:NPCBM/NEW2 domain-containing protein [Candidatus Poribacteria bacterium]
MKLINLFPLSILLIVGLVFSVYAGKSDCTNLDGDGAKPIKEVAKEDVGVENDYDEVVEEDDREGVVYLALIGGSQPKPNGCGLIPKNPAGEWTGWGGPLNFDNVTIGEGATTRNHIVIGGTYFERGIGAHSVGTFVYDLSGGDYVKFEGYAGMSDEKDPGGCGHGGSSHFIFSIDGKDAVETEVLKGAVDGENVEPLKVEFEIPANAKELTIVMGDGGDGLGCDHSCLGDAKLITSAATAVEPANKLPTIWGSLKARY